MRIIPWLVVGGLVILAGGYGFSRSLETWSTDQMLTGDRHVCLNRAFGYVGEDDSAWTAHPHIEWWEIFQATYKITFDANSAWIERVPRCEGLRAKGLIGTFTPEGTIDREQYPDGRIIEVLPDPWSESGSVRLPDGSIREFPFSLGGAYLHLFRDNKTLVAIDPSTEHYDVYVSRDPDGPVQQFVVDWTQIRPWGRKKVELQRVK